MTLLTLEAYAHPRTIGLFKNMLDRYAWWGNKFFEPCRESRLIIEHPEYFDAVMDAATGIRTLPELAAWAEKDLTRNMRPEVSFVDNGKNGTLAFSLAAAASLAGKGEDSLYAKARDAAASTSFRRSLRSRMRSRSQGKPQTAT